MEMEEWVMKCSVEIFLNQAFPKLPKQGPLTSQRSAAQLDLSVGYIKCLALSSVSTCDSFNPLPHPAARLEVPSCYILNSNLSYSEGQTSEEDQFSIYLVNPPSPPPMLITKKVSMRCAWNQCHRRPVTQRWTSAG